jgi:hypothetical protein
LCFDLPYDPAAEYLCLSGIHDPEIEGLIGPLTLSASVNGEHLGTGNVQTPGPFVLCWALPAPTLERLRTRDSARRPCAVVVDSPVAVVPERFWPSDDRRTLAFRFVDLAFHPSRPPGSRMASVEPTVGKRLGRGVAGIARRMGFPL